MCAIYSARRAVFRTEKWARGGLWVEEMRSEKVDVLYVGTGDNYADTFTKLLSGPTLRQWMKENMANIED